MSVETQQKQLSATLSNFQRPLTFNEWSAKFGVSSRYIEPTKYFKGNPSCGIQEKVDTSNSLWSKLVHIFS